MGLDWRGETEGAHPYTHRTIKSQLTFITNSFVTGRQTLSGMLKLDHIRASWMNNTRGGRRHGIIIRSELIKSRDKSRYEIENFHFR